MRIIIFLGAIILSESTYCMKNDYMSFLKENLRWPGHEDDDTACTRFYSFAHARLLDRARTSSIIVTEYYGPSEIIDQDVTGNE